MNTKSKKPRPFSLAVIVAAGAVAVGGCMSPPKLTADECREASDAVFGRIPVSATNEQRAKFDKEIEELNKKLEKSDCAGTLAREGNPAGGF